MCTWLVILVLLGALLYLNRVGLPGFVKKPLLQKLRTRGIDLQFTRLRWRLDHGIVAENVHFGRADESSSPKLTLDEVEVNLDYRALARLQFQVESLILRRGSLVWPIRSSNTPPRSLCGINIQTELHLLPGDRWQLDHFGARFAGGDFQLTGTITNASAVRDWKWVHPRTPTTARLSQWADALEQVRFSAPSRLSIDVRGDARNLPGLSVQAKLDAAGADTPWGTFQRGLASIQLIPATGNALSSAEISFQAENAQTPWVAITNMTLILHLIAAGPDTNAVQADLDVTAARVETKWGGAAQAHLETRWVHSITNAIPLSGQGKLGLAQLETRWGSAGSMEFTANLSPPDRSPLSSGEAVSGWWTNLVPYAFSWECRLAGLRSSRLEADELLCAGRWRTPDLHATRISVRLYSGTLNGEVRLEASTRQLEFSGSSDFDLQRISPLLTEKSRDWLSQYSWITPPRVQAEGTLMLPEWTNRHPDWRGDVKPTVQLRGHFHLENGTFRKVPASMADSHFHYSNEVWRLPDLVITRPEGRLELALESNERTRDYYFRIHSTIDVRALRPLLEPNPQRVLALIAFTRPPTLDGEAWGRWYEPGRMGIRAHAALDHFTLRGESAEAFQADLEYTNRYLTLIEPRLVRDQGTQRLAASRVGVDYSERKVYLTNGFSTAAPAVVARAIGPHVSRALEPYRFLKPPTVRVEGIIPLREEKDADLHFDVDGGPFEWLKFRVPHISGRVDWEQERLALKHVRTDFYHGTAMGNAEFDFHPEHGTDFHFFAAATNVDLHQLMGDLSSKSNQLEGSLTAELAVTRANSGDWQSWQGQGYVSLRDGLIWEIPIFGILSAPLDAMMPGLGSSRASEGSASFAITNGIISTSDLELRASIMRLQYWGNIDFKGRVDAHAEAELLRDTWVVGRVLSMALWPVSKLFEYRITGTLHEPKIEPVFFVPRLVFLPFHPLRTLKDLVPEEPDLMQTNAPVPWAP